MLRFLFQSFPIQLLFLHLRKNLSLLLLWFLLLGIILNQFGVVLGIPFLFLDPEYLHEVSWLSFFLMGLGLAVFTMVFHMTTYIMDGWKFAFLAVVHRPFIHFCLNNFLVPLIFYLVYIIQVISFQLSNHPNAPVEVVQQMLGFCSGSILTYLLLFGYFRLTNKGFFLLFSKNLDKRLRKVRMVTKSEKKSYNPFEISNHDVAYFINSKLKWEAVRPDISRFETAKLMRVFQQNHWNLFYIQVILVSIILSLGLFNETEYLQFPAAMSAFLLLTILLMAIGALTFWLRSWAAVTVLFLLFGVNYFSSYTFLNKPHQAYGLDYSKAPIPYTLSQLDAFTHPDTLHKDKSYFIEILDRWKAKFPEEEKPTLVIVCASGGGQRAALWTLKVLQELHQATKGNLTRHAALFTGASGGVIGEAFFREIYLRSLTDSSIDVTSSAYLDQMAADNLNPIIFSLLVNDLLLRNQNLSYGGRSYVKDRGYAFEEQLNRNTRGILDKPLGAYKEPERLAQIPLLPISALITNDGRKLVISPHPMSFFGSSMHSSPLEKKQSVDFMRFFAQHDASNLRFLTALRMGATFPFITPNVALPSSPVIKTMDTGLSDNFGIQDALRFIYVFQDWISVNTGGVLLVAIRDSEKSPSIESAESQKIIEKIVTPLKNIYANWDNVQSIHNEVLFSYMSESMPFSLSKLEFEYSPEQWNAEHNFSNRAALQRASLNWRLTHKEKLSILSSIHTQKNEASLDQAKLLVGIH